MSAPTDRRVVMIGIDAAEQQIVQSMMARGKLPSLAKLFSRGNCGSLASPADLYSGAVWPTFYTGQRPAWHGIYHNKLWQPARMCCVVPDERTFAARPFWETFARDGLRSCVVDVPLVLGAPRTFEGLYVNGWATHDTSIGCSSPATLWRQLRRQFGRRVMPAENFGPQNRRSLLQLCGELVRATEQLTRIGSLLLRRERWDFSCIVFGAAHRAGHYLWDPGEAQDLAQARLDERLQLEGAVEHIYAAVDDGLGQLLAESKDALVLVFSLHGMGPNTGWSELVPAMLDARRTAMSQTVLSKGFLYRARRSLVTPLRPVLQLVPPALSARFVPLWSSRMFDWPHTPFFPLPMDFTGMIRVNLSGRERDGIVAAGGEYETVCTQLEEFFHSLRDAATDQPIVSEIRRTFAETPASAPQRVGQPDLIVRWRQVRTRDVKGLRSTQLSSFRCDVPRYLPSGRSGNHEPLGWFIARGPGVPAGVNLPTRDILDLAPTVRAYLGLEPDPALQGQSMLAQG